MAKTYSDDMRHAAVTLLEINGYPENARALGKTAKSVGVPTTTLRTWYKKAIERVSVPDTLAGESAVAARVDRISDLMADKITLELEKILVAMERERANASYKDLALAYSILYDKLDRIRPKGAASVTLISRVHQTVAPWQDVEEPIDITPENDAENRANST